MGCCGEDIDNSKNNNTDEIKKKVNDENKIIINVRKINTKNIEKDEEDNKNDNGQNYKKFDFYQDLLESLQNLNSNNDIDDSEEISYEHLLDKNWKGFFHVFSLNHKEKYKIFFRNL